MKKIVLIVFVIFTFSPYVTAKNQIEDIALQGAQHEGKVVTIIGKVEKIRRTNESIKSFAFISFLHIFQAI